MPKEFSFIEEADKVRSGKTNNFRIQWNNVSLGDKSVVVERPAMTLDQIHKRRELDFFNFTPAFVKMQNRARCSLCKMWFSRDSVTYQVSNHRLVEMRKTHGLMEEGRRYRNACYLYGFVSVCLFCAQLFDEVSRKLTACAQFSIQFQFFECV